MQEKPSEKCSLGSFGDPLATESSSDSPNCQPCNCSTNGGLFYDKTSIPRCSTDTGECVCKSHVEGKVIYPKYSKHWPYTVAHTIYCVCSKMLNHGLNHGLYVSLFKLTPCPIHWIVYVLAYLNFIFEFWSSFSTAQNGPLYPDT